MKHIRSRYSKSHLFALATIILWASAFPLTKLALGYYSVHSIGVLRYTAASAVLLIIALFKKIGLPALKDIPKFLVSGALGFTVYMIVFNEASRTLSSATGSILISSAPVITALLAGLVFRERIHPLGWAAIGISFIGILVLTLWDGVISMNTGVFWMLAASLCISLYNLFQRQYAKRYTALQSTAYNIFAGTLLLQIFMPKAAGEIAAAPPIQWAIIIFMGLFPSALAYLFWATAISCAEKTSDVTNFMFVTPFLASIMGFIMIGEMPSPATFAGGVLIIGGLLVYERVNVRVKTLAASLQEPDSEPKDKTAPPVLAGKDH